MGKKISFTTDEATGFSKGSKRLRGDSSRKVEVKRYNPFSIGELARSLEIWNVNGANIDGTIGVYMPVPLIYPNTGTTSLNRIGAKIFMKYLRLKGYFTLMNRMVCPIRWRLCLVRVDFNSDVQVTINQSWYLGHFLFSDTTVQTQNSSVENALSWSRHNFYKKVKDVNDDTFKRKVIASGFFPAVNTHMNYDGQFAGTSGDKAMSGAVSFKGYNGLAAVDQLGFIPVDVTVKLFDGVDCSRNLRRYYLVLETDNCIGYDDDLTPTTWHLASSVLRLSVQGLVYFTDA